MQAAAAAALLARSTPPAAAAAVRLHIATKPALGQTRPVDQTMLVGPLGGLVHLHPLGQLLLQAQAAVAVAQLVPPMLEAWYILALLAAVVAAGSMPRPSLKLAQQVGHRHLPQAVRAAAAVVQAPLAGMAALAIHSLLWIFFLLRMPAAAAAAVQALPLMAARAAQVATMALVAAVVGQETRRAVMPVVAAAQALRAMSSWWNGKCTFTAYEQPQIENLLTKTIKKLFCQSEQKSTQFYGMVSLNGRLRMALRL
jgi:hypothetical protein